MLAERLSEQPGGVGVLDETGIGSERSGNPDADRSACTGAPFELCDQMHDRVQRSFVIVTRRVDAQTRGLPVAVEGYALDLGATQIDADAHKNKESGVRNQESAGISRNMNLAQ